MADDLKRGRLNQHGCDALLLELRLRLPQNMAYTQGGVAVQPYIQPLASALQLLASGTLVARVLISSGEESPPTALIGALDSVRDRTRLGQIADLHLPGRVKPRIKARVKAMIKPRVKTIIRRAHI